LLTTILLKHQRDNNEYLLDPEQFQQMIELSEPKLKEFFNEMINALISKKQLIKNIEKAKKQVVAYCYLLVGIRNKFANNFKLDLGLYLQSSGITNSGINTLSNIELSKYKSTVDDHINSKSHQENKTKAKQSSVHTYQRTLQTTLSANDNRRAIIKDLVEVMAIFVSSLARRSRYVIFLKNHRILVSQKIPLPVITHWNTWFEMIYYVFDHLSLIHNFFKEELKNNLTDMYSRLEQLSAYLQSNCNSDFFSTELDNTIYQHKGDPIEFYSIFHE
ncbi:11943_t:CDS:2, partial [Racocetra persica]